MRTIVNQKEVITLAWQFNINDRSGGDMTRAMMENNADAFISYFYGYMTAEAMAGILGNIQHESYINPGQCQIGSGTSTNSRSGGGLIQWTPRSAFISWCNARGLTWYDGDVQCYRIKCEGERKDGCSGTWLKTSQYPYTWQEFCHLTDYEEACKAYLAERERAGVAALSKRLQYAAQWYAYIESSTPIPDPDPSPTPLDPIPYENNLARYGGIKDLQRRGIISNGKL